MKRQSHCEGCDTEYTADRITQRWCSRTCAQKAASARRRAGRPPTPKVTLRQQRAENLVSLLESNQLLGLPTTKEALLGGLQSTTALGCTDHEFPRVLFHAREKVAKPLGLSITTPHKAPFEYRLVGEWLSKQAGKDGIGDSVKFNLGTITRRLESQKRDCEVAVASADPYSEQGLMAYVALQEITGALERINRRVEAVKVVFADEVA